MDGSDGLVAGTIRYPHLDELGSVRAVVSFSRILSSSTFHAAGNPETSAVSP